jgi:sigma-B regulation protein RsbU (phosphoserine phosphatase)
MCSDGILEILPADGLLKQEDYLLNMVKNSNQSIETITQALKLDELSEVPDDIAIMTIQRYPDK